MTDDIEHEADRVSHSAQDSAQPTRFGDTRPSSDRDGQGRFLPGNQAAAVVGARSARFWAAQEGARRALVAAVLSDAGHVDDPPRALALAAEGLAQAVILRDSAFARMCEDAGPLSSAGRPRRAYQVWLTAADRVERYLRLVGLQRKAHDLRAMSVTDYLASVEQTHRDAETE